MKNTQPHVTIDIMDCIIAYESGGLDAEESIELFQRLVDTGLAWQLQGHYGRTAQMMLEAGLITMDREKVPLNPHAGQQGIPSVTTINASKGTVNPYYELSHDTQIGDDFMANRYPVVQAECCQDQQGS